MVAPPGAGKGTQAKRLSARFGIEHIATGELLRAEVAADTEIGRQARAFLDRGDLVPDDVVLAMVMPRVLAAANAGGYVLDGFPRTVAQAEEAHAQAVAEDVALQAVIALQVSDAELYRRVAARARAEGRSDDDDSTTAHRFEVYESQTRPLLDYYAARGILRPVDGEQGVDQVSAAVLEALADLVGRVESV
ncbi:MAG TPA: adenylate kinase [Acidimicrobiales bacterium]|jgi:adenylate kinase|nr:adenylate kinase [Acidimicrobiales bacterium]